MWYPGHWFAPRGLGPEFDPSALYLRLVIFLLQYPTGTVKAWLTFRLFKIYFSTLSVNEIKMADRIFYKVVHIIKKQSDKKKIFDGKC